MRAAVDTDGGSEGKKLVNYFFQKLPESQPGGMKFSVRKILWVKATGAF